MSQPSLARFAHQDAQEIDPIEKASNEFYNDKISYRYPRQWQEEWETSRNGFRANAGSLDIRRFSELQELKLESNPAKPIVFGIRQEINADTVYQSNTQELRISRPIFDQKGALTVLGECGYQKEFGDLGFELSTPVGKQFQVTYLFWDVDPYYNTKKDQPLDSRSQNTQSHQGILKWSPSDSGFLKLSYNVDTPLQWNLFSEGYNYKYEQTQYSLEGKIPFDISSPFSEKSLLLTMKSATKHESIVTLENSFLQKSRVLPPIIAKSDLADTLLSLDQAITIKEFELTLVDKRPNQSWYGGLWHLTQKGMRRVMVKDTGRETGKDTSANMTLDRDETAAYFLIPVILMDHAELTGYTLHHGAVANNQTNNYLDKRQSLEIKYIAALEIKITDKTRFLLNSTWDLDQMASDFPFHKDPFKPWGGGNLQVSMIF